MSRVRSVVLVIGCIVASACEPEVEQSSQGAFNMEGTTAPAESTAEQQTSQVEQITTVVMLVNAVEPRVLDRCVEYLQFQAYVGDADALAIWDRAGQSPEGLRQECELLAVADEAKVQGMSAEMDRLDADLAAVQARSTTSTIITTTTLTAPPPPPAPPTTQQLVVPPAPAPSGDCDPNYSGCVPIASDVDCAGGSGNGPAYVNGPVQVVGTDIYGLDRDGNGVGCE